MKPLKLLFFALAAAGVLWWTDLSLAQVQGPGQGRGACRQAAPNSPGLCTIQDGVNVCPVDPGTTNRPQQRGPKGQGSRQGQGAPGQNAPNPPANPPQGSQ